MEAAGGVAVEEAEKAYASSPVQYDMLCDTDPYVRENRVGHRCFKNRGQPRLALPLHIEGDLRPWFKCSEEGCAKVTSNCDCVDCQRVYCTWHQGRSKMECVLCEDQPKEDCQVCQNRFCYVHYIQHALESDKHRGICTSAKLGVSISLSSSKKRKRNKHKKLNNNNDNDNDDNQDKNKKQKKNEMSDEMSTLHCYLQLQRCEMMRHYLVKTIGYSEFKILTHTNLNHEQMKVINALVTTTDPRKRVDPRLQVQLIGKDYPIQKMIGQKRVITTQTIKCGTVLMEYFGRLRMGSQAKNFDESLDNDYLYDVIVPDMFGMKRVHLVVDASDNCGNGVAEFVNDYRVNVDNMNDERNDPKRQNIDSFAILHRGVPFILFWAIDDIPAGHELLLDYGVKYWQQKKDNQAQ